MAERCSRSVFGIQPHVLGRQVARPKAYPRIAFRQREFDHGFSIVANRLRHGSGVEWDWRTSLKKDVAIHSQLQVHRIERDTGIAGRRNDPTPIGIGTGDGRFDK